MPGCLRLVSQEIVLEGFEGSNQVLGWHVVAHELSSIVLHILEGHLYDRLFHALGPLQAS